MHCAVNPGKQWHFSVKRWPQCPDSIELIQKRHQIEIIQAAFLDAPVAVHITIYTPSILLIEFGIPRGLLSCPTRVLGCATFTASI